MKANYYNQLDVDTCKTDFGLLLITALTSQVAKCKHLVGNVGEKTKSHLRRGVRLLALETNDFRRQGPWIMLSKRSLQKSIDPASLCLSSLSQQSLSAVSLSKTWIRLGYLRPPRGKLWVSWACSYLVRNH